MSSVFRHLLGGLICISWPNNPTPLSHKQGRAIFLSHSGKCTHAQLHRAQVGIMKEGVWTAASLVWTKGHACHSPYVPHIPKIKPRRKINRIPRQTERQALLWWRAKKSKRKRKKKATEIKENVRHLLSVCVYIFCAWPFSMLSFQLLLLNELF